MRAPRTRRGTLTPELLFALAAQNVVPLPADDAAFASPEALRARFARFSSLDDLLHYFSVGFSVLVTAADFELFFDPEAHTSRGVPYQTIIAGLTAARARAATDFPRLSVAFIPCLLPHLPVSSAHAMLAEEVAVWDADESQA